MPLYNIGSYVPTMDEFLAHWADVNTALGAPPAPELMLAGAYTRTMFQADRDAIEQAIIDTEDLENARETATAARDTQKAAIRTKLGQFRAILRANFPSTKYPRAAPTMPPFSAHETRFLSAFDDMESLWTRINGDATIPGFTPPLVVGGITLASFTTELAAVRTAFSAVTIAENDLDIGRKHRDVLLPPARERMVQYGNAVAAALGPDHPLTLSVPAVYPAPGATPIAVTLSGGWNPATLMADLSWTASTDPDLAEYEIRFSPGATYDPLTASVAGNQPPGTLTFSTNAGLSLSGDTASYKVFVRLTTNNESGSNTVTITRP